MLRCLPLLIAILLFLPMVGMAYGDRMEYVGLRIESYDPNVCIMEAEDEAIQFKENDYRAATEEAVKAWQDALNEATDSNDWDINISYYPKEDHIGKWDYDFPECDVFITYAGFNPDALGQTEYDFSKSNHKFSIITIWTMKVDGITMTTNEIVIGGDNEKTEENIDVEVKLANHDRQFIKLVVMHEFGHSLGLHHKERDFHYPTFKSIMEITAPKDMSNVWIEEDDVKAVILLYGEDGFKTSYNNLKPDLYIKGK